MEKMASVLASLGFVEEELKDLEARPLSRFAATIPTPKRERHSTGIVLAQRRRLHYHRGELYVSVGARVTYLYRREEGELAEPIGNFSTAKVISAALVNEKQNPIIEPTGRGLMKAAEILGVKDSFIRTN